MAILNIPDENHLLQNYDEVRDYLAGINIIYEYWKPVADLPQDASTEEVLSAYSKQINELKRRGGYVTADVISVNKNTPGLDAMLAKFNIEHRHDEDEVRYILSGRGLFHIHSQKQQQQQQQAAAARSSCCSRSRSRRPDLHSPQYTALVRSLWRQENPCNSSVPRCFRLDTSLHT